MMVMMLLFRFLLIFGIVVFVLDVGWRHIARIGRVDVLVMRIAVVIFEVEDDVDRKVGHGLKDVFGNLVLEDLVFLWGTDDDLDVPGSLLDSGVEHHRIRGIEINRSLIGFEKIRDIRGVIFGIVANNELI
jgi:hypothetical protein